MSRHLGSHSGKEAPGTFGVVLGQVQLLLQLGIDRFGATRKVACVAVRTHERRILPGILLPSALPG
jgi:hypothetical protein